MVFAAGRECRMIPCRIRLANVFPCATMGVSFKGIWENPRGALGEAMMDCAVQYSTDGRASALCLFVVFVS